MKIKGLRFILPLGIFALLLAFLLVGLRLNPREVPSPLIGKPAPAFSLPLLATPEQRISREDLLGKVWVLNVFASWCAPCRVEHPLVTELAERKLAPVYGLNYKDQTADVTNWLAQLGNPFAAVLVDADGRTGIDFGVYGVPETFVVDHKGIIRLKHIGPLTPDDVSERIIPLLQKLQAEQ
ncbi:DsbE family thiol:disulfide interchange protein [Piscinibacter sakaiensis]|uniref:DsbE family thiol:disulfide interchange protein n=1 Tax=Piscinibacter sakaiensis TaxID=1547922 RepID=UPI003AACE27A